MLVIVGGAVLCTQRPLHRHGCALNGQGANQRPGYALFASLNVWIVLHCYLERRVFNSFKESIFDNPPLKLTF